MHSSRLILLLLLALALLAAAAPTYKPIPISTQMEAYALSKQPKLVTAKDKAIFWSLDPPAGYADMNEYLKKTYIPTSGGKVLLFDKILADGAPPKAYLSDRGYWAAISKAFAAGASGEVVYLVGNPRAGFNYKESVFFQTELPELTKPGSAVTSIVAIDAITPANKRVIWQTGDGHWGMGAADEAATPADIFEAPTPASCKIKRAGGASCPLPGAKGRPKTTGKAGTPKGKAAAATGQSGKKKPASKGTKAPTAGAKVQKGKTQPKAAASKGTKATAAATKVQKGKTQPKAAASKKPRQKRAGPSRISGDV